MRKTSVMIDIEDDVYTDLVEPMKKNKSFGKVVAMLLTGYLKDSYIRNYADGMVDDMRKATVSYFNTSINDMIDNMEESLGNMGYSLDELHSVTSGGHAHFQKKASAQAKVVGENQINSVDSTPSNIEQRMSSMEIMLQQILGLLGNNNIQISPTTSPVPESEDVENDITNNTRVSVPTAIETPVVVEVIKEPEVKISEPDVEYVNIDSTKETDSIEKEITEDTSAMDVMNSLLQGNSFSF